MKRMIANSQIWALGFVLAGLAGMAKGQTMLDNGSQFTNGYGRTAGQENQPISVGTRDANGNRLIVDGIIQVGADNSVYARAGAFGAGDSFAGAGALGGASAVGNSLNVTVQGSWNTVIVNSNQTNTGAITATTDLTGKVDLSGH